MKKQIKTRIGNVFCIKVGDLKGENRKANIGLVVTPYNIVDRIKTGKYQFAYSGFE